MPDRFLSRNFINELAYLQKICIIRLTTTKGNKVAKYEDIEVQLTGNDGNAFAIMASVTKALAKAGVSKEEIELYQTESMSGDYDNLLRTAVKWVTVS